MGTVARSLLLCLPLPDKRLTPNGRLHHMARARLTAEARRDAAWLAAYQISVVRDWVPLPWFPAGVLVRVDAVVRLQRGAKRGDADNTIAWFKVTLDSLTDAQVWADDSQARWGELVWGRDTHGAGDVQLTLTAMGEGER